MPKPRLSVAKLRDADRRDLTDVWRRFRRRHPDHRPYAFVLYGVEGPPRFSAQVLTEEGLTQVAHRYIERGHYEHLDEARKALRYSVPDSPHFQDQDGPLPDVEDVLGTLLDAVDESAGYELLAKAAIEALKKLDAEGLFGTGPDRDRLLLLIVTEDTETDWSKPSAQRLNSASAYQRFVEETTIPGEYASCKALAVAEDGKHLFGGVSRSDPEARPGSREEFIKEIVSYGLQERRLERRWTYSFPSFGDSVKEIAFASDGTAVVLRARYSRPACDAVLMRFRPDSDIPIAQGSLTGEPSSLAVAEDGARIAVTMLGKELHVLDQEFSTVWVRNLDARPFGSCFLRSGELLVATEDALLRLSSDGSQSCQTVPVPAHRLVLDDAQRTLAVSRWFPLPLPRREEMTEFGVRLFQLPSLEELREIIVPGHQCVFAALSPDGRLLAFEACEIARRRRYVVVFATATGQEVARRKSDSLHDLCFLPDSRTLALAVSGHMVGDPIQLWGFLSPSQVVATSPRMQFFLIAGTVILRAIPSLTRRPSRN